MHYDIQYFSLVNAKRRHASMIRYKNAMIFCNENPEALYPPKIALKEIIRFYKFYPKNAKPKHAIPFISSDFNQHYAIPSLAWLGHSSIFLTYKNLHILVDPIFSMYASPLTFINRAFKQTKCYKADDFPSLFAVIITHAHFDHLDKRSVMSLHKKTRYFICPLKVGQYLKKWGIESHQIIELDWWEGIAFSENNEEIHTDDKHYMKESGTVSWLQNSKADCILRITATPAQHNANRGDGFNKTLWASFVVEFHPYTSFHKKIFLSGDGGYYTHFQRIGEAFGGFDVACLESGQYNKAWRFSHSFPHEIVKEALDLQTKMVLPIHWGRFVSGSHDWNGVIKYLYPEFIARKIPCVIPMIGEIYHIGSMPSSENWWDIE